MPTSRDHVLGFLQALVRIDSRNPGLEVDGPGERDAALQVQDWLHSFGWQSDLHDLGPGRANLVARRPGTGHGSSLMLNVHLDTVGVAGMSEPFSGALRDGRVYGRGAQDTKGGAAAVLEVARRIAENEVALDGDLVLAFVADEEHESIGTTDLVRHVRTDAAVVLEPSDLDVVIGHRGFAVFEVEVRGHMAHGGRPDVGVDANLHLAHVLVELGRLGARWKSTRVHPEMGAASLHVPIVQGGRHLFVYADRSVAQIECRTIPGQTADDVQRELREALEAASSAVPDLDVRLELVQWRTPYEIDPERPVVRDLLACCAHDAHLTFHPWWEDSALLGEAGIDTVVMGPRGGGLHTEEEWVDFDSVVDLADILYRLVLRFCRTNPESTRGDA